MIDKLIHNIVNPIAKRLSRAKFTDSDNKIQIRWNVFKLKNADRIYIWTYIPVAIMLFIVISKLIN